MKRNEMDVDASICCAEVQRLNKRHALFTNCFQTHPLIIFSLSSFNVNVNSTYITCLVSYIYTEIRIIRGGPRSACLLV